MGEIPLLWQGIDFGWRRMSDNYEFEIGFYEDVLRRDRGDAMVTEILAGLYTKAGRVDEGLKLDRRLVRMSPNNATAHYNLACSLALKNRKSAAIRCLREALQKGFQDLALMRRDADLHTLHGDERFESLFTEYDNRQN